MAKYDVDNDRKLALATLDQIFEPLLTQIAGLPDQCSVHAASDTLCLLQVR